MKKSKLSRSITLILGILFMIILGTIIIGIFFSNKVVAAAPTCDNCGEIMSLVLSSRTDTTHLWRCNTCGSNYDKTGTHEWNHIWDSNGDGTHHYYNQCKVCNYKSEGIDDVPCSGGERRSS